MAAEEMEGGGRKILRRQNTGEEPSAGLGGEQWVKEY